MRRKHRQRYPGRFTRLARLARFVTAGSRRAAAGLLLALATLLVITPAQGNAQSATYTVTFTGKFTGDALASGVSVPSGAHFTTLIGAVHNGSVTFWSDGGTASAGIELMAELGGTGTLTSEINDAMPNALRVIRQSIASGGTATATVDITLTTDHPLVTLTSMIAPSPDWFVGVSGLSLRNTADDGWQPSLTVNLYPWDAGTENGTEFSLSNPDTSPQGTITSIKGTGKFSDEPIATLTFTLQPELTLAASPAAILEAGGSAMATVEITNGATFAEDQDIALSFAGTATKGTDYTVALETLTLTAGQSSVATTVTAVQDMVDDDAETILITASYGGGTIGTEQTITIIDDDPTPCSGGMAGTYPCSNVDLMSFLALDDIGGGQANDIWGWTDSTTDKEYAIMGRSTGTSFVDVSDPVNPTYLGNLPPHSGDSTHRDIKVYEDHAFIVTEATNSGMQVFDLTQLRMVASPPATFSETAHYSAFSHAHNLVINEDSGFAYAVGSNTCSRGLHMINIQTPTNPTSAGCFSDDGYTHDAQCVNYDGPDDDHQGKEICLNSNVDTLTIVDVTNKASPVMLSRTGYSGSEYTHQGWLTEDQAYFLLGDEADEERDDDVTNTRTYLWDVSDLDAPVLIGSHDSTTTAIDHNLYVKGKYTYQSNYHAGLRILDITDIANGNLTETAFFDFNPGSDPTNVYGGTWSNYPFFDSGIVIVSVIEQGLFILRPNLVDEVNPALAAAAVNEAALTLTYGEAPDESSMPPATDAFTVTVAGSGRMVTNVSVSGRVVTLTLASAVVQNEVVTVSYMPGTNPIQDTVGNDAAMLTNHPVTNNSPDTIAPTIDGVAISSNPPDNRDTYAIGNVIEAAVTFDEAVVVTGRPQLTLNVGGLDRTAIYDRGSNSETLVFAYPVASGDLDIDGVSIEADSLSGGTIRDPSDNDAELDHDAVAADTGHKVDGVRPVLAASDAAVVDGTTLTLTYNKPLDGSSTPVPGDFTVDGGDHTRTVTGVRVNGSAVELTLDPGAEHEEAGIQVSYTVPTGAGANPIRDALGNAAVALSREPVTNDTPDTTSPEVSSLAITSNPGGDQIYAAGDEIEVTVTFDETVVVEGTPQLRLRVGTRTRTAGYDSGTGAAALVFAYEVAVGDLDTDGVSIEANRIALNGGTIEDEADNDAVLDHEAVASQAGHKVDGVRPELSSAAVDGSSLTLTYEEALDEGSQPASGDFTVEVDGSGRSVSGVSVSDTVVTLTLNPEVEHGDTGIRVSYSPGTNPIRDAVGNDAVALSNRSVTNTTGAPNTAPSITSPSSFDVPENQALVRRLSARDTDPGDEVTGWEIVGGADQGQFTITSDTGDLSFRTPPDFEAPGDNEYEVTVEVRSGAGARELEAEQTFTLRVTDEREPPGIPEAPTFSGETAESLTVNWSEPDNTGPAITDYDVQYREKGTGRFTDGQHVGPGRSLTLDDLEPGTAYEVQVRATNDEGTSDWSESGEGMTVTPLTVPMTTDLPPPVEGPFTVRFSFSETVTGFSSNDIDSDQNPACTDSANNPVFCDPSFAPLQTTDDRIFTTTVTPQTDRVAHNYTLTLTVPAGRVTSIAGNKPNEEAMLEVRVAPPGVTVPISSIGLRANAGNGQVTLRWSTPANTGGAAIIRYEYRFAAAGEDFSAWENVRAGTRRVTVEGLINGTEYVFEVRAVNALGKGGAETVSATPDISASPPPPPPGGGFPPPSSPTGNNSPTADAGPDQLGVWEGAMVTLDGSGSSDPDDDTLRYRWNQFSGQPVVLSSRDIVNPTFTAPEGLTAEAVLRFRLLVTDPGGHFDSDTVTVTVDPDAEPPPEDQIYYFPHLAVGAGWQTTITYINYSLEEVTCQTDFLADDGTPLMVSFADLGTVPSRSDILQPGESVHEETNVALSDPQVAGWARAACSGPVKASLLYRRFEAGVATGKAGVNAATVPASRFITFAEQGEGQHGTAVAYANPSDTQADITFTARAADGEVLASDNLMLSPNGHGAKNMVDLFDLTSFTGWLEVTATEPIVSLAINAEADPVFSSLPPGELDADAQDPQQMTTYFFPHLAVGAGWQTTITYINYSLQQVSCRTEFLSDHGSPLLVSFAGRATTGSRDDILPPGGSVHEETNVALSDPLAPGWARATCSGPLKASLLYRRFEAGVPTGEAGVNATTIPADRFVTFAEQGEGKPGTAVAYANPSDTTTAFVTFTVRDADGNERTRSDPPLTLLPRAHGAQNMVGLFDLTSFSGWLEITSTAPIVTLSINAEADPVFSSLPPGEVDAAAQ